MSDHLTPGEVSRLEKISCGEHEAVYIMVEDGDDPDFRAILSWPKFRELLLSWRALKGCLVCGQESAWGEADAVYDVIDVEPIGEDQDD